MPPPPPARPGKKEIAVVRALYSYTAENPDELSFEEGSVLYVVNKDDANWWKCRSDDKEGLVPSNYVGENTTEIENPLHEAAKRGNVAFARELLSAGLSVNALDKAGNTPLHWAARGGHSEIVSMILAKNPAVNAQNKLGDAPLHSACWGGSVAVVSMLLEYPGINPTLKNKDGQTPRDLAKNDQVASLIIQFLSAGTAVEGDDGEDSD